MSYDPRVLFLVDTNHKGPIDRRRLPKNDIRPKSLRQPSPADLPNNKYESYQPFPERIQFAPRANNSPNFPFLLCVEYNLSFSLVGVNDRDRTGTLLFHRQTLYR